jgi:cytochrome c biogenesis protein CcmG/thiol:disulfide interchange protein DsbE
MDRVWGDFEKGDRRKKVESGFGKRKIWRLILLVGVILLLGYGLGKFELSARKPPKVECLGKGELSAPLFSLPDMNGQKVDLVSFKGQVIVLEFWATWCAPCREEIPVLNQIYKAYREKGLVVIGISLDRKPAPEVKKFLDQLQVEYLNVMGDDEIFEKYSQMANLGPIRGIPATFVIDRQGQICQKYMGLTEKRILEEAIKAAF